MILICLVIFVIIKNSKGVVEPSIAMCIDGEVDTAVLTRDGSTYIFMSKWFWKLNHNLDAVVANESKISDQWPHLPESLETSFYYSENNHRLNGKTFFVKNNIWYQFENQTFEKNGSTKYWYGLPKNVTLLAFANYNDPIVVFFNKHNTDKRIAYLFDSPYFPEEKRISKESFPFDISITRAFISYPNKKVLVFYDDDRIGHYCIRDNLNSGCVKSGLNRNFFQCPDYTENLFNTNLFVKIWFWSGLGMKQFAILILGIQVSLFFIFSLIFLLMVLLIIKKFK